MANFRGFTGLRSYTAPLNRDLRELERYLSDLDERVAALISEESIGSSIGDNPTVPISIVKHARTHATKVDAGTGSDPLDKFYMKWRKRQLIQPDLETDVTLVPFQVKASGTDQTGDMVNLYDRDGNESYTLTNVGISAFGAATEAARVNVKNSGVPSASAPDEVSSATPTIWFDASRITGIGDGNETDSEPIPEKLTTNEVVQWHTTASGDGFVYNSGSSSKNIGGYPTLSQAATVGQQELSDATDEVSFSPEQKADMVFIDGAAFSFMAVYHGFNVSTANPYDRAWSILGRGIDEAAAGLRGIAVPARSATAPVFISTSTQSQTTVPAAGGFNCATDRARICIVRRSGDTVKVYCTEDSGSPVEYSRSGIDGEIVFDGFFTNGTVGVTMIPGVACAEMVVFRGYLSDAETLELYQWAAAKYGLTALTSGGSGDLIHGYDADDDTVLVVDATGLTAIGKDVDPTIRLQVRDTTEQVRVEYNGANYASFEVESDGDLKITPTSGLVGVNTSPSATIHALDTTEQLRLGYDASNYINATVATDGAVTFDSVGNSGQQEFVFKEPVAVANQSGAGTPITTGDSNAHLTVQGLVHLLDDPDIIKTGTAYPNVVISMHPSSVVPESEFFTGQHYINGTGEYIMHGPYLKFRYSATFNCNFEAYTWNSGTGVFDTTPHGKIDGATGDWSIGGNFTANAKAEIRDTGGAQMRLAYDESNHWAFTVGSGGLMTMAHTGSAAGVLTLKDAILVINPETGNPYIYFQDSSDVNQWRIGVNSTNLGFFDDVNDTYRMYIGQDGDVGIGTTTEDPAVRLTVRDTTEQTRIEYDVNNYFSTTVAITGDTTFDLVGTTPEFTFNDPVNFPGGIGQLHVKADSTTAFLVCDAAGANEYFVVDTTNEVVGIGEIGYDEVAAGGSAGCEIGSFNDVVQLAVHKAHGGQTSDLMRVYSTNDGRHFWLDSSGRLNAPVPYNEGDYAEDIPFIFISHTETGFGEAGVSFLFTMASTVGDPPSPGQEPTRHTRWDDSGSSVVMELMTDGSLYGAAGEAGGSLYPNLDTANAYWQGAHRWAQQATFDNGLIDGTQTQVNSGLSDGGGTPFLFDESVSKTTGNAFEVKNSADSKEMLKLTHDGRLFVGYSGSIGGYANARMSFNNNDTGQSVATRYGMVSQISHNATGPAVSSFIGAAGVAVNASNTGFTTSLIAGLVGTASNTNDSASYSGKVLAGVVGNVAADSATGSLLPNLPDLLMGSTGYAYSDAVPGNWDHVATFWGQAMVNQQASNPSNLPAVCSVMRGVVPETTNGEAWIIYGDTHTPYWTSGSYKNYYGAPITAAVSGSYRAPWPRHGTRRTHLFLVPGDFTDTSGNADGDIAYHDGTGSTYAKGLHEYRDSKWWPVGSSDVLNTVSKTGNYTATVDDTVILCDPSSGGFTITLPAAASHTGKVFYICNNSSSSNTITIDGNGSETIDGNLTKTISSGWATIPVLSDGTNWKVL